MVNLDIYGFRKIYKGTIISKIDEGNSDWYSHGKLLINIPDLILNKTYMNEFEQTNENLNVMNIVNNDDLRLTNNISSINGIICRPLIINNQIPFLNKGDEVMVIMIDNDPKKLFYLNITTQIKTSGTTYNIKDEGESLVITRGKNIIRLTDDYIELDGEIRIKGE